MCRFGSGVFSGIFYAENLYFSLPDCGILLYNNLLTLLNATVYERQQKMKAVKIFAALLAAGIDSEEMGWFIVFHTPDSRSEE